MPSVRSMRTASSFRPPRSATSVRRRPQLTQSHSLTFSRPSREAGVSETPARAGIAAKNPCTNQMAGGAERLGARDEETRTRTTNLGTYDCDAITFCTKTATSPSWSRGMPLSSQNWIATILGSSPRFQLICKPGRPASSTGKEKS